MSTRILRLAGLFTAVGISGAGALGLAVAADVPQPKETPKPAAAAAPAAAQPAPAGEPNVNWSQWGGSSARNNTPVGKDIPTEWEIGEFDYKTGAWDPAEAKNIKWVSKLGSQTYGNPVVHNGKVFVGTNNGGEWIKRFGAGTDLGCMLCFDIKDGKFLWQHSNEKHPAGRVYDWPLQGVCSAAYAEGDRIWFVTNMGEIRCLDVEGFHDGENDGPFVDEQKVIDAQIAQRKASLAGQIKQLQATPNPDQKTQDKIKALTAQANTISSDLKMEADVVWIYDMMKEMGISQHNMCSCSITSAGDVLFVCTSNGVDVEHNYIPAPDAPSFFAIDKNTGKVLWTDNSPGLNIHHGQWSSPTYAVIDGQAQALFGGGDGYLYSFDPAGENGKSKLLWKFDSNPKTSKLELMGKGTRNDIISTPVVYDNKVYFATGQDPEHGEGIGTLWCLDPTKRGDVSKELAFNASDPKTPIPHKRVQAVVEKDGDFARPNPNSAVIWEYNAVDRDGDGEMAFEETFHRSIGTVAIRDDILYIADFSGMFHCVDAQTGKVNWVYDMLSAAWGSPLIVEDKVYIGDEDGEISIFKHSADPSEAMREEDGEMVPFYGTRNMGASVYSTPVVAGNVLYISNQTHLFAITPDGK
ncbi:PQQ-binding-like beta-propeller repeat protein [Lacipirellula sp.]|uniref:outer membrane protein assembly factor BamB family protein n=1 Tax=Lacipirellula sp. TaxID=2691419 RepID=UPI003D10C962